MNVKLKEKFVLVLSHPPVFWLLLETCIVCWWLQMSVGVISRSLPTNTITTPDEEEFSQNELRHNTRKATRYHER